MTLLVVAALLAIDFVMAARRPHEVGFREAVAWSAFYIAVALAFAVVFAAFVAEPANVVIGTEHVRAEWLTVDEALVRYGFPGERASLREVAELLASGDAGAVEDVMRIF